MATFDIKAISPVYSVRDEQFFNRDFPDGQSFRKGTPVVLGTNGQITEAAANPTAILGFTTNASVDYEWKRDTFNTTRPSTPVALVDQEFYGTLLGTFAETDRGARYGLTKQAATGQWVVDKSKTATNERVQILRAVDNVEAGDINAPVLFSVLPANRQVTS